MTEAGRELDALIAKAIYGWDTAIYKDVFGYTLYIVDKSAVKTGEHSSTAHLIGGSWERGYDADDNLVEFFGRICPAFSTDIAAAWQVVEEMNNSGRGRLELVRLGWGDHPRQVWRATFFRDAVSRGKEGRASTAPCAICLAALALIDADGRNTVGEHGQIQYSLCLSHLHISQNLQPYLGLSSDC